MEIVDVSKASPGQAPSLRDLQRQIIETLPSESFSREGPAALAQLHESICFMLAELDAKPAQFPGEVNEFSRYFAGVSEMIPTADLIVSRLMKEDIDPKAKVYLANGMTILREARENYPNVPYYGAHPGKEFSIGKDLIGVGLRIIRFGPV